MNIKILSNNRAVAGMTIVLAMFAVLGSVAYAKSIFDIEFPIAELGSCKDKTACKAYCDVAEHQDACENFAAQYGIAGAQEKKQEREARKESVMKDGGPGNCAANASDPASSCRTYCSARDHMSECVLYGKEHGLMKGRDLEEAEKVLKALESGVELPAGCTDEKSCKQTCEEPKNVEIARSCFAFAEKAGLLPEGVDRDRAEKVFKLIEEGKAPFKSPRDFKQCENPANDEIMQKCVAFATDNGLMSPEDAEIVKKTGGKGPGDCRGKEQCDVYCGEHPDECMQFAETHDLIKPEEKTRMQEGMLRLKENIANMPPEAKQCLVDIFGQDKLDQILAGSGFVGRDFGEKMRTCFEKSFNNQNEGFHGTERRGIEDGAPGIMLLEGGTSTNRGRGMFDRGFQGRLRPQSPESNNAQYGSARGPLGCKNREECSKFCSDPANRDACREEFNRGQNERRGDGEKNQERNFTSPQQFNYEGDKDQVQPPSFPMKQGIPNEQNDSHTMMNPPMFQGGSGMMGELRDGVPPQGSSIMPPPGYGVPSGGALPSLFPQNTAYPVAQ